MKRLQNLEMVDGDDKNDIKDMEDMKYQGEDEDHVSIVMENNINKKKKTKINQEDVDKSYGNS